MTPDILEWGHAIITAADVRGKWVLEVGSNDVNGSLRPHIEAFKPRGYVGVDMLEGGRVDRLLRAEELLAHFGPAYAGLVVSTEMLEHAEAWQECIWNMMVVTRPLGVLVLTTRSPGFPYHGYPGDWWRFTVADMEAVFANWDIEDVRPDPGTPGVFVRARRPPGWDAAGDHDRILAFTAQPQPQPRQL